MSVDFDFSQWCESNGLTPKTATILKDQDLHVLEAVKLLSPSDIAELGLTKGKNKLLYKAVNELRAPELNSEINRANNNNQPRKRPRPRRASKEVGQWRGLRCPG